MLMFWVAAGVLAAAAAGLILLKAAAAKDVAAADPAPAIYRRQLGEIDDLAEQGLIGEGERKSAHAEAARRLLAAADAPARPWADDPKARIFILFAVAATAALALGLYLRMGAAGAPDQPYAERLAAWSGANPESLTAPQIAAVLRAKIKERPGEAEGLRLLALVEASSGEFPAAVRALRKALQIAPERADLWRMMGEALMFQAGGKVDAASAAAFQEALKREPGDPASRFYLAVAKVEAGQGAQAAQDFRALLAEFPPGDERRAMVEAAITRAEGRTQPRIDEGQMAAIRGMVASLAAKLEANPDDSDGWVRLVRAYAVLGDTGKRDAAYASAQARYAGEPNIRAELDEAARAEPMR